MPDIKTQIEVLFDEIKARDAEIERLRSALEQIVAEAESDNGLTAWDGSDIAKTALRGNT